MPGLHSTLYLVLSMVLGSKSGFNQYLLKK